MKTEPNRIYFKGNPYPNGHKISKFIWSGRIDENQNIWFDFHLESDKYYAEDESDDIEEPETDWKAKIVWGNYHSCKISSINWGEENKGIKLSKNFGKFNFDSCIKNEFVVDKIPLHEDYDYQDLAFDIYLLGHDSSANHKINFEANDINYNIQWSGKIALTYGGDYNFDYEFMANINNVKFDGFHYPKSWTLEKAKEVFLKNIENFDEYQFIDLNPKSNKREYKLVRREK